MPVFTPMIGANPLRIVLYVVTGIGGLVFFTASEEWVKTVGAFVMVAGAFPVVVGKTAQRCLQCDLSTDILQASIGDDDANDVSAEGLNLRTSEPGRTLVKDSLVAARPSGLAVFKYLGGLVLVVNFLFPPWVYTFQMPGSGRVTVPAGYAAIFRPPEPRDSYNSRERYFHGVAIDLWREALQTLAILGGMGILWFAAAVGGFGRLLAILAGVSVVGIVLFFAWPQIDQNARAKKEQAAKIRIPPANVELVDLRMNSDLTWMSGRVRNNDARLGLNTIELRLRVKECPAPDRPQCETVGDTTEWISVNVPPHQAREFAQSVHFSDMGNRSMNRTWSYEVVSISGESPAR